MKLQWALATDTGRVRRVNQDSIYADGKLFAVADGMGGHAGGEVASKLAVETLSEIPSSERLAEAFRSSFSEANRRIMSEASHSEKLKGMGTTLTAALVTAEAGKEVFLVQNIGDSRAYFLHRGELQQITKDHTYVGELLRSGSITEEQAAHHSQRHVLTKALGVEATVDSDIFKVSPSPGDILLLCSDGLINHVTDGEIEKILMGGLPLQQRADRLIESANLSGGTDNISVILVEVLGLSSTGEDQDGSSPVELYQEKELETVVRRKPELLSIPRPIDKQAIVRGSRIFTLRVAAFLLLFLLLVGGVLISVQLYENHSYFVGDADGAVAIFHGHPGGLLWYSPSVVQVSSLQLDVLNSVEASAIKDKVPEPSLAAAESYIRNLKARVQQQNYVSNHPLGSAPTTTTTLGTGVG